MGQSTTNPRDAEVFISYAQDEDAARAVELADYLEAAGATVWMAERSIEGAQNYGPEIIAAIRGCRVVVLLCSEASLSSEHVAVEMELAFEARRPRLPLLLEQTPIPDRIAYWLTGSNHIDITGPSDEWLPKVLRALNRLGVDCGNSAHVTASTPGQPPSPRPEHGVTPTSKPTKSRTARRRGVLIGSAALVAVGGLVAVLALAGGGGGGGTPAHVQNGPTKSEQSLINHVPSSYADRCGGSTASTKKDDAKTYPQVKKQTDSIVAAIACSPKGTSAPDFVAFTQWKNVADMNAYYQAVVAGIQPNQSAGQTTCPLEQGYAMGGVTGRYVCQPSEREASAQFVWTMPSLKILGEAVLKNDIDGSLLRAWWVDSGALK